MEVSKVCVTYLPRGFEPIWSKETMVCPSCRKVYKGYMGHHLEEIITCRCGERLLISKEIHFIRETYNQTKRIRKVA